MAAKAKKVDFDTYKTVVELGMPGVALDTHGDYEKSAILSWLLELPDKRPYYGYLLEYWILVDTDEED